MRSVQTSRPVFPIGLLTEDRPCLVVGGGHTGLHKTELLLAAGARVTVVSPDLVPDLQAQVDAGRVHHLARPFRPTDLDGVFVAFATTGDRSVNLDVIRTGQEKGVLVCSADRNWIHGDFITPATFRRDDLVVAISTGGRSCRRSRLVKETLARHMAMIESADLLIMGTSHQELSLDEREPYHRSGEALREAGRQLAHVWGVHEFMLLNTCNRIEVVAAVSPEPAIVAMLERILGFDALGQGDYYARQGLEAFEHLCLTCAGLLSQTAGETNIVGQVKDGLTQALDEGWCGGIIQDWVDGALHVSKHLRSFAQGAVQGLDIEDLAWNFLCSEQPELDGSRVAVLGTGTVGRGLVRQLVAHGCRCLWAYHSRKPELPGAWGDAVELCTLAEARRRLGTVDVIVSALAAPGVVLSAADLTGPADTGPALAIDLGIPRTIDPDLASARARLRVIDLDDLKGWQQQTAADLTDLLDHARSIVQEHAEYYEKVVRRFQGRNA